MVLFISSFDCCFNVSVNSSFSCSHNYWNCSLFGEEKYSLILFSCSFCVVYVEALSLICGALLFIYVFVVEFKFNNSFSISVNVLIGVCVVVYGCFVSSFDLK